MLKDLIREIIREELICNSGSDQNIKNTQNTISDSNKYYIVRTYSAGVFFGKIISKNGDELIIDNCQKIHAWVGACAVEQLAIDGVSEPDKCRITVPVNGSIVKGWIQIIPCLQKSVDNLKGIKIWKK